MKLFILRTIKEGIFTEFFVTQENKINDAIDALYDEIFMDAFIDLDCEQLNREQYLEIVTEKVADDE